MLVRTRAVFNLRVSSPFYWSKSHISTLTNTPEWWGIPLWKIETSTLPNSVWSLKIFVSNSFSWLFPQPISSCVHDNQYSAEHLRGNFYTSPEFSPSSSLLGNSAPGHSLKSLSGSKWLGLPCLFPILQGSLFFIARVQCLECQFHKSCLFFSCFRQKGRSGLHYSTLIRNSSQFIQQVAIG